MISAMNKKNNRQQTIISGRPRDSYDDVDDAVAHSKNLLHNIHKKLDNSAALNGGFDRLLYKIDSIENAQIQIVDKVDKIHEAIYNPDDGLFSRIAANKASQIESVTAIQKQISDLSTWQKKVEEEGEDCEEKTGHFHTKLKDLEVSVKNLETIQKVGISVLKWAGVAIGGGLITLLFKIFLNSVKQLP